MSILSNQTPKDLERQSNNRLKKTGSIYDTCFFDGAFSAEMDCDKCPHNKHCSWHSEKEFRQGRAIGEDER